MKWHNIVSKDVEGLAKYFNGNEKSWSYFQGHGSLKNYLKGREMSPHGLLGCKNYFQGQGK
jgi:hypothetical protein